MSVTVRSKKAAGEIYQIKVTLLDTDPPIWRRLLIPADVTLESLHYVVQAAMGWECDHAHEFRIRGRSYGETATSDSGFGLEGRIDEGEVAVDEVLRRVGSKATYLYDFGDGWKHEILVEKRLPADPKSKYPVLIGGARACPPEDCGGVWAYYEMLEAIRKPKHPRHGQALEWLGAAYDPEAFSLEKANAAFAGSRRRSSP